MTISVFIIKSVLELTQDLSLPQIIKASRLRCFHTKYDRNSVYFLKIYFYLIPIDFFLNILWKIARLSIKKNTNKFEEVMVI